MASKETQKTKMAHIKNPSGFDVGLIGLAVMGQNLARNIADKGFDISVFNRTMEKTAEFVKQYGEASESAKSTGKIFGAKTIAEFTKSLKTPRKIIIMVKAGEAVDQVIAQLLPHLTKGDIIMDGGNSYYKETATRQETLSKKGIHFIGMGISGGEEGALKGPSIMPGGDKAAYEKVARILEKIAAENGTGGKCITYIGPGPCGHFVKTVHNGIEYAVMQLIAESYDVLRKIGKFSNEEIADIFEEWNKTTNLNSYLLEITIKIFRKKEGQSDLIDLIQDQAQQKGTGKWTTFAGMDYGTTTGIINAAVDARILSGAPQRGKIGLPIEIGQSKVAEKKDLITQTKTALELSTILAYFQGFDLISIASRDNNWQINLSEIANIWRGGCIIRSSLLSKLQDLFSKKTSTLLQEFAPPKQNLWRKFVCLAISHSIPVPSIQAALAYYDSYNGQPLPQNLTQAQRDFFGAHGYAKIGQKGTFHTDWQ